MLYFYCLIRSSPLISCFRSVCTLAYEILSKRFQITLLLYIRLYFTLQNWVFQQLATLVSKTHVLEAYCSIGNYFSLFFFPLIFSTKGINSHLKTVLFDSLFNEIFIPDLLIHRILFPPFSPRSEAPSVPNLWEDIFPEW